MMRRSLLVGLGVVCLTAACGTDVLLGADPEAADAAPIPFFAGAWALILLPDLPVVECRGSLVGREAAFDLSPAAVGIREGTITLSVSEREVAVSGAPIDEALGVPSLILALGEPGLPIGLYAGRLRRDLPGPEQTSLSEMAFGLYGDSANDASMVGRWDVGYTSTDGIGGCAVVYPATYGRP